MIKLSPTDYLGDPFAVAKHVILGAIIETRFNDIYTQGMITEVEVYIGGTDKASHTYGFKRTKRVLSQYEAGGHTYVFLVYGIHTQFCVVIGQRDEPNVVLIRSIEPLYGTDTMLKRRNKQTVTPTLCSGPGNVTKALGITTSMNGVNICTSELISLYRNTHCDEIIETKRVGIDYAEEYADVKWRFYYKNNPFVSKKIKIIQTDHPLHC